MQMVKMGNTSYWHWACCLKEVIGKTVSKQAIFGRMNSAWVDTVKTLVQQTLLQQAGKGVKQPLFRRFKNVWIQDSTCLQLPEILFARFRCSIKNGEKKSVAKLNIIMNAISGYCPVMEWESFTVSEFKLAKRIRKIAMAGDLVIRDLGYFILHSLRELNDDGIYYLSRLRYGICLRDQEGQRLDLLGLLKGKTWIDQRVVCGENKELKTRLVVLRISARQANERRRKARKDHHRHNNHGKKYYALLDYIIFITNVEEHQWNYKEVCEVYRIRWNVEILFKSWKSGFKIRDMIPSAITQTERVESVLYLMLLYIAWFGILIYQPLRCLLEKKGKYLSLIKVAKWVMSNIINYITEKLTTKIKKEIAYYCCYDMRHDRINAALRLDHFFNSLS
jgi:hypothetical protein